MLSTPSRSEPETFTVRLERRLTDAFISAANTENRPASKVLRDLMPTYVEDQQRMRFKAEACRKSKSISALFDENEVDLWFQETRNMPGWKGATQNAHNNEAL